MPLDAGEQPRGEQRVAAELKEILLRADLPHAKQLLPELCEDGFDFTLQDRRRRSRALPAAQPGPGRAL